jgi:hypothetical protein
VYSLVVNPSAASATFSADKKTASVYSAISFYTLGVRMMLVPLTPAARDLRFPAAGGLARMWSVALMELFGMVAILF